MEMADRERQLNGRGREGDGGFLEERTAAAKGNDEELILTNEEVVSYDLPC